MGSIDATVKEHPSRLQLVPLVGLLAAPMYGGTPEATYLSSQRPISHVLLYGLYHVIASTAILAPLLYLTNQ